VAKCYFGLMAQPVKLSEELVLDARLTAQVNERSISSQVEYWARLGRAVEGVMRTRGATALKRLGDAKPVSQSLAAAETPTGRARLQAVLAERPFPHFEAAKDRPGLLIKIDADGKRTVGRFVHRVFTPVKRR
jgi:hypothetical protein